MAGETKTPEQLQAELTEALSKVDQLTGQVRGIAAERDTYREQLNGSGGGRGGSDTGASSHVLGKVLGVDADYGPVDAYYVTREQHQQELQQAVKDAYALARGDMLVLRAIDQAKVEYKDLGAFDSPLSKKTLDILQKEGYGDPRRDPKTGIVLAPAGWEDLVYESVNSLPRAARMARAELLMSEQSEASAAAANASAQGAAGMASGGAPVTPASPISDEAWMKAAEAGDAAGMKELLKQHAQAVTGQPVV